METSQSLWQRRACGNGGEESRDVLIRIVVPAPPINNNLTRLVKFSSRDALVFESLHPSSHGTDKKTPWDEDTYDDDYEYLGVPSS